MKYTYLLINIITLFFPLVLSFDKKVQFYKSWKFIWPGMALSGLVFLFWDVLFTVKGVWGFNSRYITGITVLQLPIEEILFFLTVPFACLFIYACLNYYIRREMNMRLTRVISNLIIIFSILVLIFYHHRLYTSVTFSLLAFLVVLFQFMWKSRWLSRFYFTYLVALIPFYIINGLLTALPVVMYNDAENLGRRIGTIPFEDHFYCMALLLMNIGFFEYFRSKSKKHTMADLPQYTRSQLALRNGQDKPEIWIAYKGTIYDVSRSRLWFNGKHYEHWAGQDLTAELADAPHTDEVFTRFDPIGQLK